MKIIHCSDLHLDSKMESNLDNKKAKERRDEILMTYQKMVQYAQDMAVRVIIIAGDMFDRRNVSLKTRNIVLDSINSHPNIDFVYLAGNHDEANFISNLETIPGNLKLFNSNEWITYKYGKVTIAGIESDKLGKQINNTLILNKNDINIVVLHGQELETNMKYKHGIINLKALKNNNIDYLALGHIHTFKQEKLDNRGIYCYSGCLEGRGFDECGEKGFVLLDIDEENMKIESKFVPFAMRRLYEINVDVSEAITTSDAEKMIDEATKNIEEEALVKIVLNGDVDLNSERDIDFLEKKYNKMFYFAKICDETTLKIDYMSYKNDASLKGEFIRLVMKQDLTDEEKQKIIMTGIKAIRGEEVN